MTGVAQNRRGFGQKAAARACSGVKALPRSSGQGDPKPGIETENNSELFLYHHPSSRPLDTRSTLPVLARVSAGARCRSQGVVLVRKMMRERRNEDRPAVGFSKKKP